MRCARTLVAIQGTLEVQLVKKGWQPGAVQSVETMAANPALVNVQGVMTPAPFQGETLALRREGVEFLVDGLRTESGK